MKKQGNPFSKFNSTQCKTSCRMCLARFTQMRNKKNMMIKNLKKEVADLLRSQSYSLASIKTEQVINEEKILNALGHLELYITQVQVRVELIAQSKEIPRDMVESISSIVYAGSRMPECPELVELKKAFGQKYGSEYIKGATSDESANANWGVKDEFRQLLYVNAPYNEDKLQVIQDIAKEYSLEIDEAKLEGILPSQLQPPPNHAAQDRYSDPIINNPNDNPAASFDDIVFKNKKNKEQENANQKIISDFPSVNPSQGNQGKPQYDNRLSSSLQDSRQYQSQQSFAGQQTPYIPPNNPDFRPKHQNFSDDGSGGAYSSTIEKILAGTNQPGQPRPGQNDQIFENNTRKDARWPPANEFEDYQQGSNGGPQSIQNVDVEDQELKDMEDRLWQLKYN